jgi:hypothetical protein
MARHGALPSMPTHLHSRLELDSIAECPRRDAAILLDHSGGQHLYPTQMGKEGKVPARLLRPAREGRINRTLPLRSSLAAAASLTPKVHVPCNFTALPPPNHS